MINFPINLRCYVILGCRVINVILAINIGDSAFFDIAALVRQFGGLRHHQQTESIDRLRRYLFRKKDKSVLIKQWIHWPPPQTKILATPLDTLLYIYLYLSYHAPNSKQREAGSAPLTPGGVSRAHFEPGRASRSVPKINEFFVRKLTWKHEQRATTSITCIRARRYTGCACIITL